MFGGRCVRPLWVRERPSHWPARLQEQIRGRGRRAPGQGPQPPLPRSPPASPPALAGPACQGKRPALPRAERETRECGRPSGPEGGRGVGRAERQRVCDKEAHGTVVTERPLPQDSAVLVMCAETSQSAVDMLRSVYPLLQSSEVYAVSKAILYDRRTEALREIRQFTQSPVASRWCGFELRSVCP